MHVELEKEIQTLVVAKLLYDVFNHYGENKGMEITSMLEKNKRFKEWFPDVVLNDLMKDKRYEKIVFQYKEDVFKELTPQFELYKQLITLKKKKRKT
ncbi:MAG: hypothetical protein RMJ84_00340 [Sandaracinaceae bacterium]|nr:hypothetical protein [Sandaracinaceae bacterium]